ncbi:MAG: DUF2314 domain-containing protein [Pseudomonadota bacterium]
MTPAFQSLAAALLIAAALPQPAHAEQTPNEETTTLPIDAAEQAMLIAIADAQQSFPRFWQAYQAQAPGTDRFATKIRLQAGSDGVEHVWVTGLAEAPVGYTGILGNEPERLSRTFTKGDTIAFGPMDVTDWGYAEGTKLRGHFTTRARLPKMAAMEADQIRSLLHDDPFPPAPQP